MRERLLRRCRESAPGRFLSRAASAAGVERETLYVYAAGLDDVRRTEPPAGVAVSVNRATDVDSAADAEPSTTPPSASTAGVQPSDFVAIASEADGSPVGWALVRLESPVTVEERGLTVRFDGAYLWGLFVDPRERGRGVGSALVAAASEFAASDRVRSAYALVAAENEASRRAFERVGYDRVEVVSRYRLPLVGRYVPALDGFRESDGADGVARNDRV